MPRVWPSAPVSVTVAPSSAAPAFTPPATIGTSWPLTVMMAAVGSVGGATQPGRAMQAASARANAWRRRAVVVGKLKLLYEQITSQG
ncbi:hypothetical protein D3C78_1671140 [compost metagenome]